jgi:DNA processing protein
VATFFRLLGEHHSAQNALAALPEVAHAAGVENYSPFSMDRALAEYRTGLATGARLLCITDDDYPADLKTIPDPPPLLWVMGQTDVLKRPMISLVGARNASSLGMRMARGLATDLSKAGFVIVSGLARGIDTTAHMAALETGTIAVMGGGVDVIYPSENQRLGEDILHQGLRLSEQPMGLTPQARHFPRRNRLISGLARAVIVVEAAGKSGSLITARDALDQGREVLAVPGHPMDAQASGCNMLIRDGAQLVRNAQDVLAALPLEISQPELAQAPLDIPAPAPRKRALAEVAALHTQILERLGPSPLAEDQLIRDLGQPARHVSPALVNLELDGQIQRDTGGLLRLVRTTRTG